MRILTTIVLSIVIMGCSKRTLTPVEEISRDNARPLEAIADYIPDETDWPMWRGLNGNGIAVEQEIPLDWQTHKKWSVPIPGRGHGSPTVVGSRIFLASADEQKQKQFVIAYDRESGDQLWMTEVSSGAFPSEMHPKSTHANGTLACDGLHVYGAFLNHDSIHAVALTLDGDIAWQRRIGAFDSKFGYAPSPTIYGPTIIIAGDNRGGGYIAALHRKSGDIIWLKKRDSKSTYSSPIIGRIHGKNELLISGCDTVNSYAPDTGELNWSLPGTSEATCGTMVWSETMVFASGGYPDEQTIAIDPSTKNVIWSNRTKVYEPSLLLVGGYLYAASDRGIGYCWDASTGEERWKKRLGGNFSSAPVFVSPNIILTSDDGVCTIIEANPNEYKEVTRNKIGDDAFATPTICGGQIFLRVGLGGSGRQERLICIQRRED